VDGLLKDDGIVSGPSPREETALERANNLIKERAQPVNQYLGNEFIHRVAKTDRSELLKISGIISLRN
jgi:hypothetical protein